MVICIGKDNRDFDNIFLIKISKIILILNDYLRI